jgi:hypothetical protein
VRRRDLVLVGQVRDGARDAEDARVGAGRQAQAVARGLEERPPARVDTAEAADVTARDAGVEPDAFAEPRALPRAGRPDARGVAKWWNSSMYRKKSRRVSSAWAWRARASS